MEKVSETSKKGSLFLPLILLVVAFGFLSLHISVPLTDYDEATYARIVTETLNSGEISHLILSDRPFLEKPPLYFWLAMGAIQMFGEHEFAFRLPAILAAVICLWLVYLIVRELTGDMLAASAALLILLLSPLYYFFATEARLDQGVILGILTALYFWIRGWNNEKYLLGVLPALAVAFLFKSVIAFLFAPIILIYCLFYGRWAAFKSKYLWWGLLPALIIVVPWHVIETLKYGSQFWNVYLFQQSIGRSFTQITGDTNNVTDYLKALWDFGALWLLSLVAAIGVYLSLVFTNKGNAQGLIRDVGAPLCVALVIMVLFTAARTHLEPYVMPAFPFIALFLALLYHHVSTRFPKAAGVAALLVIPFLLTGIFYIFSPEFRVPHANVVDEATTGKIYKEKSDGVAPLYSLGGPYLETVNYYAGTTTQFIDPQLSSGMTIKGPFYAMASIVDLGAFFYMDEKNNIRSKYGQELLYTGTDSILIYSEHDFVMP